MQKHLVSINDLPPDGKEFTLDDQNIWIEPIREFKMACEVSKPLKARIFVQRVDEGILLRGDIQGEAVVPCDRCAEDAIVDINSGFDEYEEISPEPNAKDDARTGCIVYKMHAPMLDLGEVCWEQFMLALPPQPLCDENCKGLCPQCGANLNNGQCSCEHDSGDPRLAILRDMKIKK